MSIEFVALNRSRLKVHVDPNKLFFSVKREVDNSDDEGIKIKEQAILDLGHLLAETKQAKGRMIILVMMHNIF